VSLLKHGAGVRRTERCLEASTVFFLAPSTCLRLRVVRRHQWPTRSTPGILKGSMPRVAAPLTAFGGCPMRRRLEP